MICPKESGTAGQTHVPVRGSLTAPRTPRRSPSSSTHPAFESSLQAVSEAANGCQQHQGKPSAPAEQQPPPPTCWLLVCLDQQCHKPRLQMSLPGAVAHPAGAPAPLAKPGSRGRGDLVAPGGSEKSRLPPSTARTTQEKYSKLPCIHNAPTISRASNKGCFLRGDLLRDALPTRNHHHQAP